MHTNSYQHRKNAPVHHTIPFFLVPCLTVIQTKSSPFSESPKRWRSSSTSLTLLGHITQKASPGWYSKAVSCFKTWNIPIKSYYKPRHSHSWQQPSYYCVHIKSNILLYCTNTLLFWAHQKWNSHVFFTGLTLLIRKSLSLSSLNIWTLFNENCWAAQTEGK